MSRAKYHKGPMARWRGDTVIPRAKNPKPVEEVTDDLEKRIGPPTRGNGIRMWVLGLHYFAHLDYRAIAERVGMSYRNVHDSLKVLPRNIVAGKVEANAAYRKAAQAIVDWHRSP